MTTGIVLLQPTLVLTDFEWERVFNRHPEYCAECCDLMDGLHNAACILHDDFFRDGWSMRTFAYRYIKAKAHHDPVDKHGVMERLFQKCRADMDDHLWM